VSFLVGLDKRLVVCNRSKTTICDPDGSEVISIQPGFSIYELPEDLTEKQIRKLLLFEKDMVELFTFLNEGLKLKLIRLLILKNQPANTCAWTNVKGALLATLFLKKLQTVDSVLEQDQNDLDQLVLEKAYKEYSLWATFTRWDVLVRYKKTIETTNSLIEAVESKACYTYMIKQIKLNPALAEKDLALKNTLDKHIISLMPKKQFSLIYRLENTSKRLAIIQAIVEIGNEWLNEKMRLFMQEHQLMSKSMLNETVIKI
jgi:hypothetical protein